MIKEYEHHIKVYSDYWFSSFSKILNQGAWGDQEAARCFLEKYWLSKNEYFDFWKKKQNNIFCTENKFSQNSVFLEGYCVIKEIGGCLFTEKSFEQLMAVLKDLGNANFVIVQNKQDYTYGEPMFRMKFPTNITWKEIISGNYISAVLLEMHYNEYFVFGDSCDWGKYAGNEFELPLDIIGFKPELADIFLKYF